MTTAWRIVKSPRADMAFDGEGARLHGGRWSSPGTAIVYAAQGQSLAALELLVHLQASRLLAFYSFIPASFDDALVQVVDPVLLPPDWRQSPAPTRLREIGDRWVTERQSVILRVPSAVVPSEFNFLVNPTHSDFAHVTVGQPIAFRFDRRLK